MPELPIYDPLDLGYGFALPVEFPGTQGLGQADGAPGTVLVGEAAEKAPVPPGVEGAVAVAEEFIQHLRDLLGGLVSGGYVEAVERLAGKESRVKNRPGFSAPPARR